MCDDAVPERIYCMKIGLIQQANTCDRTDNIKKLKNSIRLCADEGAELVVDLGFEPIETSVGKLGVLVCWDQWYPEAARLMAMKGAEMLIYPTAIGWGSSDTEEEKKRQLGAWITVQRGHAVANGLPVITVNRTGHETDPSGQTNGIQFWGNSFVAGPQGELLAEFPNDHEEVRVVEIDKARSENVRRWWPFFRDRRIDAFGGLTERFLI